MTIQSREASVQFTSNSPMKSVLMTRAGYLLDNDNVLNISCHFCVLPIYGTTLFTGLTYLSIKYTPAGTFLHLGTYLIYLPSHIFCDTSYLK